MIIVEILKAIGLSSSIRLSQMPLISREIAHHSQLTKMEARLVPLQVQTMTMVKSELNLAARTRHRASQA